MSDYFDIPEIAYCRINRAAQLINCEVEDIFHWMETETINGYVNIPYEMDSEATFHIPGNKQVADQYLEKIDWAGGYFPFTAYSIGTLREAKLEDEEYPTEFAEWFESCTLSGLICGVWKIDSGLQYLFDDEDSIQIRRLIQYGNETPKSIRVSASVDFHIKKMNLWVVKSDIEKLAGKRFRSLDGGLGDVSKRIANDVRFIEGNAKTTNKQAQFIKSLLRIHYGEDVAESPRRFLEKKDSEISMDFQKMDIVPPSGKAVQSWTEMVDIPFADKQ